MRHLRRFYAFSFRSQPSRTNLFNRNMCPLCLPQVLPTFLSEFRDKLLCLCVDRLYFRRHSFVKSESSKDALLSEPENPSCGVKAGTGRVWWQRAGVGWLFVQLLVRFSSLRKAGPLVSSNLPSIPWPQSPLSVCWVARSVILSSLGENHHPGALFVCRRSWAPVFFPTKRRFVPACLLREADPRGCASAAGVFPDTALSWGPPDWGRILGFSSWGAPELTMSWTEPSADLTQPSGA